jgi:hypothetical protein
VLERLLALPGPNDNGRDPALSESDKRFAA